MALLRLASKRGFDLVESRAALYAENFVWVAHLASLLLEFGRNFSREARSSKACPNATTFAMGSWEPPGKSG